jgi:hypothetical protein
VRGQPFRGTIPALMMEKINAFLNGSEQTTGVHIAAVILVVMLIGWALDSLLVRQERLHPPKQ